MPLTPEKSSDPNKPETSKDSYREQTERTSERSFETKEAQETQELEKNIRENLERQVAESTWPAHVQEEVTQNVSKRGLLDEQAKLKHLLDLARTKGVLFAI